MSTAIAMAPSPAPHDRAAYSADIPPANTNASPTTQRTAQSPFNAPASGPPPPPHSTNTPAQQQQQQQRSGSGSPRGAPPPTAKPPSPPSASRNAVPPRIIVKKEEPGSPEPPTARHRPKRLDLTQTSISRTGNTPQTARPSTARDGLGIQEVGLACLSPGFVTQDPVMKEQLQRSVQVRDHQRQIIESRLQQQQSAKFDGPESSRERDGFAKTPGMSRRNKAPPGLRIVAPSADQFSDQLMVQSAPLGQTFTGRNNHPMPLSRHLTNPTSNLSSTSHIHHVPANQTENRLPAFASVFGGEGYSAHPQSREQHMYAQQSHRGPLTSPGHPPPPPPQHQQQMPSSSQRREFRSAEEAQAEMAAGRPDLMPNVSISKRRRDDYEDGNSPPLGNGRPAQRRGPFGDGRDSPDTQHTKRQRFLAICAEAWDLFHN